MAVAIDRVEQLDSRYEEAAACVACGSEIAAGDGMTASYRGRTVRLKCAGCLERFEAEPERYLTGHPGGCCPDDRSRSPASEWTCD